MKRAYQWIIRDNQNLSFPEYILTSKFYSSKEAVWKDYGPENTEFCFHPIRPLPESKLTGDYAWVRTKHERESGDE